LTVAILIFFIIVLTLTALFWLWLTGLTALLTALSGLLSGLSALLVLSPLIFFFHIVRHEYPSLIRCEDKVRAIPRLENLVDI
jgi:hypothetical protein